jgi:hypothetical protein
MMQRVVSMFIFLLVVFGVGFVLGMQMSPLHAAVAWGFGGVAVLPVVLAYLAAARQGKGTGAI